MRHQIVRFTITNMRNTKSTNLTSSKILLLLLRVKTMLLLLELTMQEPI